MEASRTIIWQSINGSTNLKLIWAMYVIGRSGTMQKASFFVRKYLALH
jgi:hypothetical protein